MGHYLPGVQMEAALCFRESEPAGVVTNLHFDRRIHFLADKLAVEARASRLFCLLNQRSDLGGKFLICFLLLHQLAQEPAFLKRKAFPSLAEVEDIFSQHIN